MEEIGYTGAEDGYCVRQEPVRESAVAPRSELQHETNQEQTQLRPAPADISIDLEIVRRCLAARRGEHLDHPEHKDDLRDLRRQRFGEDMTDERTPFRLSGVSC